MLGFPKHYAKPYHLWNSSESYENEVPKIKARCRVFEDNSGAIEIAKEEKYRPRTKHINCHFHHFRSFVNNGSLSIEAIKSEDNPADILTHPVTVQRLAKHVTTLLKWDVLPQVSEGVLQYLLSAQSDYES